MALERQINPFLRSHLPTVIDAASRFDGAGVSQNGAFATLRQWKNQYT
jgi:hydroxyacylglutathione hydrolase